MNPLAVELNETIKNEYPELLDVLSDFGKKIFFPKGILFQTAEAKKSAHKYNATVGIAKEKNKAMYLPSLAKFLPELDVNEYLPYAPAGGNPELRKKWKELQIKKNPSLQGKKYSLPVVTSGITHGISLVGDLFVDEGDVIIIPDKLWGNYRLIISARHNAEFQTFPFYNENNTFNLEAFDNIINEYSQKRDKIILLLNFPNNPSGYAPTQEESDGIIKIIEKYSGSCKFVILLDEAYFALFYEDDIAKETMFSRMVNISKNVFPIKLDGPTKEDYVWGFRTGFISFGLYQDLANESLFEVLEKKVTGTIRSNISNCSNVSQALLLRTMSSPTYFQEKEEKYNIMLQRYKKLKEVLSNPKFDEVWSTYNFNSGYFMCIKLKEGINAEELRVKLLKEEGVGIIAINEKDVRIAFSCTEVDTIEDLFKIIYRTALKLKN